MLLASISVGVISGLFISAVRLKLGMPGHKAFLWMTPVLIVRLLGKCKVGSTAGALFAALTTYSMGCNLAGGVIGMPLIVGAGVILDWAADLVAKEKMSRGGVILLLGLAGVAANLVCFSKRIILPTGLSPHFLLSASGFWFRLFSYGFFGLLSGVVAGASAGLLKRKNHNIPASS